MSKRSELRDQLVQRELSSVWPQWSISNYIGSGSFGDVYEIFREENGNVYKSALPPNLSAFLKNYFEKICVKHI